LSFIWHVTVTPESTAGWRRQGSRCIRIICIIEDDSFTASNTAETEGA